MSTNIVIFGLPHSTLVGIDLLCFTSSPHFHGIAAIPPGWHFLFTSPTTSLSIRHGTWLFISPIIGSGNKLVTPRRNDDARSDSAQSNVLVFQWSNTKEELTPLVDEFTLSRWRTRLELSDESGEMLRRGLFQYRQTASDPPTSSIVLRRDGRYAAQVTGDPADSSKHFVEESTEWALLTAHLSRGLLERVTKPDHSSPSPARTALPTPSVPVPVPSAAGSPSSPPTVYFTLTTSSTSPKDRDDIPGLSVEDARDGLFGHEEKELGLLDIDLKKTWRDGAVGRERTEGARDRSWALQNTVERSLHTELEHKPQGRNDSNMLQDRDLRGESLDSSSKEYFWGTGVLGEMELCFLAVLTLSNYSCLEQWKRLLTLVLTSYAIISSQPRFFVAFLDLLLCQLRHCDDVEGGLFEVGLESGNVEGIFLRRLLVSFKKELEEMRALLWVKGVERRRENAVDVEEVIEKMQELEIWLKEEWRWELNDSWVRRGMVELEDGERVEVEVAEMEGEDERGEYAPVVVEI